jgi:hypothetical protein
VHRDRVPGLHGAGRRQVNWHVLRLGWRR